MSDVQIVISAETQKALKDIQSFSSSAISSFKAFGVAAAAYLGGRAISSTISSFIDAASESEQAINALNISLASAGTYSEKASEGLQAFATQMQNTTGISDELILNQLAIARNFTKTNEEAQKLTQAAIQLSAATGKDLDSSIQALGKSIQGVGGSLEKTVPATKGFTEAQLKAGAAVDFVLQRFGGVAEAKLQSFSGVIQGTKNSFGDMLEVIGDVIIKNPVLITLIDSLRKTFIFLGDVIKKNQGFLSELLTKGLKALAAAIPTILKVIEYLVRGFGALVLIVGKVISKIIEVVKIFSDLKSVKIILNSVKDAFIILGSAALAVIGGIFDLISAIPGLSKGFKALGIDSDKVKDKIDDFGASLVNNFNVDISGKITEGLQTASESVDKFSENAASGFGEASDVINNISIISQEAALSIEGMGSAQVDASKKSIEALNKNAKEVRNLASEIENIKKKAEDAFKKPFNFFINAIIESSQKVQGKIKSVVDKVQTWVADNPLVIETVAAGAGLLNSIFKSGAQGSQQLEKDLTAAIDGAQSQLKAAITEINNQRDEAILQIEGDFTNSVSDIQKQLQDGSITQVEYQEQINKLEKKRLDDIAKENKKAQEKTQAERVTNEKEIAKIREDHQKKLTELQEKNVQAAAQVTGQFADAVGTALGLPPIFSEIINMLAAPPEVWQGIIEGLVQGIPILIQRIVENIPTIIIALAEAMPEVALSLIDTLTNLLTDPKFYERVALAFIKIVQAPAKVFDAVAGKILNAGKTFFDNIIKGASEFIAKLIEGIKNIDLGKAVGVSGGGGKKVDVIGAVGNAIGVKVPKIKLASGGTVPSGFPNDTFPAKLTSGEMVIPTSDVQRLSNFLDKQEADTTQTNLFNQLKQLLQMNNTDKNITVNLQVGEKELASVILDLNRRGFRTT